jgi:antitoxin (DNA-binding transcriptional repressor) of toxin-antitoxin stability system
MRTVGVRDLKNGLSAYLRLAKGGETILITERKEIVAVLQGAADGPTAGDGAIEEYLREGGRSGKLIRAARRKSHVRTLMKNIAPTRTDWKTILDQVRRDRVTI